MEVSHGQRRQVRPHPLRARARSVPRVLSRVPGSARRAVSRAVGAGEDRRPRCLAGGGQAGLSRYGGAGGGWGGGGITPPTAPPTTTGGTCVAVSAATAEP